MHIFWGIGKLVQLKIVYYKVSGMLYSVQEKKMLAFKGQYFKAGVSMYLMYSFIKKRASQVLIYQKLRMSSTHL